MNNTPLVSIIIANYNNVKDTLECLDSIKETTYNNYEIIVVDDGSTDNSAETLRKRPDIRLIESDKNYGFIKANNVGIRESRGQIICLLNNDTIVDKEWLGELVKTFLADEKIGATYAFFIDCDTPKELMRPTPNVLKHLRNDSYNLIGYPVYNVIDNYITTYLSASGCCLLFRKNIFGKYADEDYFMCYDDVYFCWRLKLQGCRIIRSPYAVVYHKGSKTTMGTKALNTKMCYLCEKNRLMTLFIFYQAKTLLKVIPLLVVDGIRKILLMIARLFYNPAYTLAILSAWLWLFFNAANIYRKRRSIQSERRIPDEDIIRGLSYKIIRSSNPLANLINRLFFLYARLINLKTYEIIKQSEGKRG